MENEEAKRHECSECPHMKCLTDNGGRYIEFCMFDQSPCYCEETGIMGWCELDGFAEDLYQKSIEERGYL